MTLSDRLRSLVYPTWLKHLITEKDNETPSVPRIVALLVTSEYVYLPFHAVVINHSPLDFQNFALGAAGLTTGIGAMLGLASPSERTPDA